MTAATAPTAATPTTTPVVAGRLAAALHAVRDRRAARRLAATPAWVPGDEVVANRDSFDLSAALLRRI